MRIPSNYPQLAQSAQSGIGFGFASRCLENYWREIFKLITKYSSRNGLSIYFILIINRSIYRAIHFHFPLQLHCDRSDRAHTIRIGVTVCKPDFKVLSGLSTVQSILLRPSQFKKQQNLVACFKCLSRQCSFCFYFTL